MPTLIASSVIQGSKESAVEEVGLAFPESSIRQGKRRVSREGESVADGELGREQRPDRRPLPDWGDPVRA